MVSVLMVDDDAVMRHLVKRWLDGQANCITVSTLSEAFQALEEKNWDIFLIDLNLGAVHADGDGLSLVEHVRRIQPNAACVLMTAHGKQEEFSSAVNLGIDQIMIKPFYKKPFIAAFKRLQEIQHMREELKTTQIVLAQQNKKLKDQQVYEKKLAALAQKYLLFTTSKDQTKGIDIQVGSYAEEGASGDFLDVVTTDRGVFLISGDVMGKGLGAAIVSAGIKINLRHLINQYPSKRSNFLLKELRNIISPMLLESQSLLTLSMADLDTENGILELIDCGAPHLLLQRGNDGPIFFLAGKMMPLGIAHEKISIFKIPILKNDRLIMISDGILDAWGFQSPHESYANLADLFHSSKLEKDGKLVDQLINVENLNKGIKDDRSCIAVHYRKRNPSFRVINKLMFDNFVHSIPMLREWTRGKLTDYLNHKVVQLNKDWIDQFILGVSEITTNIIKHGFKNIIKKESICYILILDPNKIWAEWHYCGEEYNPPASQFRKTPKSNKMAQSGYGMSIIDKVFDEVNYMTNIPHSQSILVFKKTSLIQ